MKTTQSILVETKNALPALTASRERKNLALQAIADRLLAEQDVILEANRADVEAARDRYGDVMIDRLTLPRSASPVWRKAFGRSRPCPIRRGGC